MLNAFDEIYLNHEDGDITVEHAILALDAQNSGHINFLSHATTAYFSGKSGGKQLLVSHEAHRILAHKMPRAAFLPCAYFRPIVLGNLQVELLPSGQSPGSSFLRIEKKNDSLLYASQWSNRPSPLLRRAAFRPANTVLLKLHTDPSILFGTTARRELERLGEFCAKLLRAGERIVVVADASATAHHIVAMLTELRLPVALDKHLQLIFDADNEKPFAVALAAKEHAAVPSNSSARWNQGARTQWVEGNSNQPCVYIVSKDSLTQRRQRVLPQGIWVWTGLDQHLTSHCPWLAHLTFADTFALQFSPDLGEIEDLVKETHPRQVLVCGEGAPTCVHHLTRRGIDAQVFAPPRLETLF